MRKYLYVCNVQGHQGGGHPMPPMDDEPVLAAPEFEYGNEAEIRQRVLDRFPDDPEPVAPVATLNALGLLPLTMGGRPPSLPPLPFLMPTPALNSASAALDDADEPLVAPEFDYPPTW